MDVFLQELRENHHENLKLSKENPELFMICPRCWGTKYEFIYKKSNVKRCSYCNGEGVICWIDRILRQIKNPFLKEENNGSTDSSSNR